MQLIISSTTPSLSQSSTDPLLIFAQAHSLHLAFTGSVIWLFMCTLTETYRCKNPKYVPHTQPHETQNLEVRSKLYNVQWHLELCAVTEHPAALHLGKRGASSLGLDGDGFGATLQDLVNVLLTELGAFILLIHYGTIGTSSKQVFYFFFGELLDLSK